MDYNAVLDFQLFLHGSYGPANGSPVVDCGGPEHLAGFLRGASEHRLALVSELEGITNRTFNHVRFQDRVVTLSRKGGVPVSFVADTIEVLVDSDPRKSYVVVTGQKEEKAIIYPQGSFLEGPIYREYALHDFGLRPDPTVSKDPNNSVSKSAQDLCKKELLDTISRRVRKRITYELKRQGVKINRYQMPQRVYSGDRLISSNGKIQLEEMPTKLTDFPMISFEVRRPKGAQIESIAQVVEEFFARNIPFPAWMQFNNRKKVMYFYVMLTLPG